jgi:hypothetical protein
MCGRYRRPVAFENGVMGMAFRWGVEAIYS